MPIVAPVGARATRDILAMNGCLPTRGSGTTGQERLTEIPKPLELACLLPILACLLPVNVSGIGRLHHIPNRLGREQYRRRPYGRSDQVPMKPGICNAGRRIWQ